MRFISFKDTQIKEFWSKDDPLFIGSMEENFFSIYRSGFDKTVIRDGWKFHVSIDKNDVSRAWDALVNNENFIKLIKVIKISRINSIEREIHNLEEIEKSYQARKEMWEELKAPIENESATVLDYMKFIMFIYINCTQETVNKNLKKEDLKEEMVKIEEILKNLSDLELPYLMEYSSNPRENDFFLLKIDEELIAIFQKIKKTYFEIEKNITKFHEENKVITEKNALAFFLKQNSLFKNIINPYEKWSMLQVEKLKYQISLGKRVSEGAQITIYMPDGEDIKTDDFKPLISLIKDELHTAQIHPGKLPKSDLQLNSFVSVRHESTLRNEPYNPNSSINQANPFRDCIDSTDIATDITEENKKMFSPFFTKESTLKDKNTIEQEKTPKPRPTSPFGK